MQEMMQIWKNCWFLGLGSVYCINVTPPPFKFQVTGGKNLSKHKIFHKSTKASTDTKKHMTALGLQICVEEGGVKAASLWPGKGIYFSLRHFQLIPPGIGAGGEGGGGTLADLLAPLL